ncbi:hypothetical protein BC936DRAFT_145380 [Jimgerdemannia flammicorona]|uniref:DNA 3'-5' helicase n=1 Tax=Jimgerdemannia flammicorona TaxID=994334 RepID=A0A433DA70_9FUNG|nr:hypothetical protein BC936DRAFT_145380 [Jimgerdemannia flammicorona]
MAFQEQLDKLDAELIDIDAQITALYDRRDYLSAKRDDLLSSLDASSNAASNRDESPLEEDPQQDYSREDFPWSQKLRELAKKHFSISRFRNLQLLIMNAAKEGKRDIFVIMPTGGGKSLCYQLPALLDPGVTLVISPLVSLIRDQVYHLQEAGVGVGMIVGATSKEDANHVMDSMVGPAKAKKRAGASAESEENPIKLVYVTPEKIAKSKRFLSKLEQVYTAGRLSRIVIDECHCCSQLGHDFRPDYKKLNIFKTIFPNTPIIALTATCPPLVLQNVISILNLKSPHDPRNGTLVFTSPLHRPNLIYRVLPKPSSAPVLIQKIATWISRYYPAKSGIVYCLSKKDTQSVADGIAKESKGVIKSGVYHADLPEDQKERIHKLWRENRLHVIVATIAFGLGINHPDVRFVIHHSMSKSVEGYYQESGRAGCVGMYIGKWCCSY